MRRGDRTVIHAFSALAAGVGAGLAQLPRSDAAILVPMQATMIGALAVPSGLDLTSALTPEVFERAWRRVRSPGGAGIDGRGRALCERDLARHLAVLRAAVLAGRWRPARLLRRSRPKADGGERVRGIPTLSGRLVQAILGRAVGVLPPAPFTLLGEPLRVVGDCARYRIEPAGPGACLTDRPPAGLLRAGSGE